MKNKVITCIVCPRGCQISVSSNKNISGYTCIRGKQYAESEINNPVRQISTVVATNSDIGLVVPVKFSKPIPKELIFKAMSNIKKIKVDLPINIGDVIVRNFMNLGVDLIATKNVKD